LKELVREIESEDALEQTAGTVRTAGHSFRR
jgi:hypothetical protein